MVVNNIDQNRNASLMTCLDKVAHIIGIAVGAFRSKKIGWIVAQRIISREFCNRHYLNGINPHCLNMVQLGNGSTPGARIAANRIIVSANMHFINYHFIPCRHGKRSPGECVLNNVTIAYRINDILCIGINFRKGTVQHKSVLVKNPSSFNIHRPPSTTLTGQRVSKSVPSVKTAGNIN